MKCNNCSDLKVAYRVVPSSGNIKMVCLASSPKDAKKIYRKITGKYSFFIDAFRWESADTFEKYTVKPYLLYTDECDVTKMMSKNVVMLAKLKDVEDKSEHVIQQYNKIFAELESANKTIQSFIAKQKESDSLIESLNAKIETLENESKSASKTVITPAIKKKSK